MSTCTTPLSRLAGSVASAASSARRFAKPALHAAVLLGLWAVSRADVVYDESISGDLSNNGLAPTVITLHGGSNQILGATGRVNNVIDRDYFTVTIPDGWGLTSLFELPGTTSAGALGFSFIGFQAGPQLTLPVTTQTAAGLIGWSHYSTNATNSSIDLLPEMSIPANGSSGFTGSLYAGTYTFWIQDFNNGPLPYGFELNLSAVPEPSTYGLMAVVGLLGLAVRRRMTKRTVA